MKLNTSKIWLIEHAQKLYRDKVAGSLAIVLATLLNAESEEIIERSWRSKVNVDEMTAYIKNNTQKVEKSWEESYEQLKPILDYGGRMEYEEMMLILGLRSDLESGLLFITEKPKELLTDIDDNLRAVLELNREYAEDCRNATRKNTGGLETYLSKHWWWRYDEEN